MARNDDYLSTARSLALPLDSAAVGESDIPSRARRSSDYTWQRRSLTQEEDDETLPLPTTASRRAVWMQSAEKGWRRWERIWYSLTPIQQAGLVLLNIVLLVLTVLFLV